MGRMAGFECDRCVTHLKGLDGWHMMNSSWVDGTATKCKLRCFDNVSMEISGSRGRPIKALSRIVDGPTKKVDGVPVIVDGKPVKIKITNYKSSNSPSMVRVGNLFLSVPYMGESSWDNVARELRAVGETKDIVVLSGIHGTQSGIEVDRSGYWTKKGVDFHGVETEKFGMFKSQFILDDKEVRNKLVDEGITGVSVKKAYKKSYIDAATPDLLKSRTLGILNSRKIVIWGWCHSIMSMRTCAKGTMWKGIGGAPPSGDAMSWMPYWDNHSIKQVIASDFDWVP